MYIHLSLLLSFAACLASARAAPARPAPAQFVQRQGCVPGGDHYVQLWVNKYTWYETLDRAPFLKQEGRLGFNADPYYFDPHPEPPNPPYVEEHLSVKTYKPVKGFTWDELWDKYPELLEVEGTFDCRIEAKTGIRPKCVSLSLNPLWRARHVITPTQANVVTKCIQVS